MLHKRPLILLCVVLVVGGTVVYATGLGGRLLRSIREVAVPQVEAFALLQVRNEPGASTGAPRPGSTDKAYEIYKQTQVELLRSPLVINAALRKPGVMAIPMLADTDKPQQWLADHLAADSSPYSEILRVSLKGPDAEQTTRVLNAVLEAYQHQVVEAERREPLAALTTLEREYARKREEAEKKAAMLAEKSRKLGAMGTPAGSVQRQLAVQHIESLERRMESLETTLLDLNSQVRIEQQLGPAGGSTSDRQADRRLRELNIRKEGIAAALDSVRKEHAAKTAALVAAEQSAATALVMDREELNHLQDYLKETQQKIDQLRINARRPPRVKILQAAICLDSK